MANFFYRLLVCLGESLKVIFGMGFLKLVLLVSRSSFDKMVEEEGKRNGMSLTKLKNEDYAESLTHWSTITHEVALLWEELWHERKAYRYQTH